MVSNIGLPVGLWAFEPGKIEVSASHVWSWEGNHPDMDINAEFELSG